MCLIGLRFLPNSERPIILAVNRDEWRARPTQPAHWWADQAGVFAGRDLQAGGTWLGIHRRGRLAALTNVREPNPRSPDAPSRGFLVSRYLVHDGDRLTYQRALGQDAGRYAGFNLLIFERVKGLWSASWLSNRSDHSPAGHTLEPGCHVLSNHLLNTPWPKATRLRGRMESILQSDSDPIDELFGALADDEIPPDDELPDTGIGLERERSLGAAFIGGEAYGTRSSTVIQVSAGGQVAVRERTWSWLDGKLSVSAEHSTLFWLHD